MAKEAERTLMPKTEVRREATNAKPIDGKKVFLQEKIFIPVNEYPNVRFFSDICQQVKS